MEVKNSKRNVEAKELTGTTHGHELRGVECRWERVFRVEGDKRKKKIDNCNSIINKVYFKIIKIQS